MLVMTTLTIGLKETAAEEPATAQQNHISCLMHNECDGHGFLVL